MPTRRSHCLHVLAVLTFCAILAANAPAQNCLHAQENAPAAPAPILCTGYDHPLRLLPEPAWLHTAPEAAPDLQSAAGTSFTSSRPVSWRLLPSNFLHDQKNLWLFPVQVAHGRHWLPTGTVIGITAGLLTADAHDAPYFRRTSNFSDFNSAFSGMLSALEIASVPSAMYAIGLWRRDSYAQQTALLSGEAVADSGVLAVVMKDVSRRLRPSDIPPYGNFSDTFFRSQATLVGAGSSFPSGHTILAFSVATVIARRYGKHHPWVRYAAYGTAAAIGFSRVTLQAHFPSDVFLGAALGYSIARFDVLQNH